MALVAILVILNLILSISYVCLDPEHRKHAMRIGRLRPLPPRLLIAMAVTLVMAGGTYYAAYDASEQTKRASARWVAEDQYQAEATKRLEQLRSQLSTAQELAESVLRLQESTHRHQQQMSDSQEGLAAQTQTITQGVDSVVAQSRGLLRRVTRVSGDIDTLTNQLQVRLRALTDLQYPLSGLHATWRTSTALPSGIDTLLACFLRRLPDSLFIVTAQSEDDVSRMLSSENIDLVLQYKSTHRGEESDDAPLYFANIQRIGFPRNSRALPMTLDLRHDCDWNGAHLAHSQWLQELFNFGVNFSMLFFRTLPDTHGVPQHELKDLADLSLLIEPECRPMYYAAPPSSDRLTLHSPVALLLDFEAERIHTIGEANIEIISGSGEITSVCDLLGTWVCCWRMGLGMPADLVFQVNENRMEAVRLRSSDFHGQYSWSKITRSHFVRLPECLD